jgi:hypothetical protein
MFCPAYVVKDSGLSLINAYSSTIYILHGHLTLKVFPLYDSASSLSLYFSIGRFLYITLIPYSYGVEDFIFNFYLNTIGRTP